MTICQPVRPGSAGAEEVPPGGRYVTPGRLLGPERSRFGNHLSTGTICRRHELEHRRVEAVGIYIYDAVVEDREVPGARHALGDPLHVVLKA
jgi:hypothetical protein